MSPTIYNINNAIFKDKMAAFDYDWTLVNPKEGKTFPTSVDDWQWLYPSVPNIIKLYHDQGYMIVIFTNQSKEWKSDQIQLVAKELIVPVFVVIATDKTDYKPSLTPFTSLLRDQTIDKTDSFFVGDALGRKTDFSDSDKVFAENIGIPCFPPEQIFPPPEKTESTIIPLSDDLEVIIMVGYPGSGKSTISKQLCENERYVHIEGDMYNTFTKMMKNATEFMQKKSIVFDATNSTIAKRKEYVNMAKKYGYAVRCLHVTTSLEESYKRNLARADVKRVPKIAYSVYKKHFEEPTEEEGFVLITL